MSVADLLARQPDGGAGIGPAPIVRVADLIARQAEEPADDGLPVPRRVDPDRPAVGPPARPSDRVPARPADRDGARPRDRAPDRVPGRPAERTPERTPARTPASGRTPDRAPDRPYDPLSDPIPAGLLDDLPERPPARMDDTDQLILGGAPVGSAMTDQYRLDALESALNEPKIHPLGPAAARAPHGDDEYPTELVARIPADPRESSLGLDESSLGLLRTSLRSGVHVEPVARASLGSGVRPDSEIVAKVHDALSDSGIGLEGDSPESIELRTRKIDESLVRLTAIHAGLGADMTARVSASSARLPAVKRGDSRGGSRAEASGGSPAVGSRAGGEPPLDGAPGWDADDGPDGRPPGTRFKAGRFLVAAVAVLLFLVSGVGWGAKNYLNGKLHQIAALDSNSDSIVDKAGQYGDENYLLVGSDSRAGIEAGTSDAVKVGNQDAVPGARSDTVMVAHIPAKRDRVVLVSFPRDLQVDRPSCDRWDAASQSYPGGTAPAQDDVKLNTAFEVGGPQCVTKVVQKLTGLSINHFTAIDFAGFKEMVDSVQGVPICVDAPVIDSVLGKVVPTAGPTTLVGDQALAFVRARHVRGDPTSDYGRIQRQQRFLSALMRKALSDQVLLNPSKLRAFVTAFGSNTLSDNAGLDELTTLAGSLQHLDPAKVTFVTVPTTGEANKDGNEVLRKADTVSLFNAVRADEPLPGEATAPAPGEGGDDARPPAADGVAPGDVTLAVRNGSSKSGLANEVAENLRSVDFKISRIGDAKGVSDGRTVVRYSPDRADQAATVEAAVPGAVAQPTPGPAGLLELVLGDDFDGEVKAPVIDGTGKLPSNLSTVNGADDSCR
ncbi:MAG TPA: LCP family protein [Pseudonocardia sp.]|nr:LCP family protein [Pseudonocardia sp.]